MNSDDETRISKGMIDLEVWLYGPLAEKAGAENRGSHAHLRISMRIQSTMASLLSRLGVRPEEKGITFVNGQLTDMPGLQADLDLELKDGDRVGIFHPRSMWPFQYRFGASTARTMVDASSGLQHSPSNVKHKACERG